MSKTCRTCGKTKDDPDGMYCSNSFHLRPDHPQAASSKGLGEAVAWIGTNHRSGATEVCAHRPSPSVMRDFNMKPLYASPPPGASRAVDEAMVNRFGLSFFGDEAWDRTRNHHNNAIIARQIRTALEAALTDAQDKKNEQEK